MMVEKLKIVQNSGERWDDGRLIKTLYNPIIFSTVQTEALQEYFTKKKKIILSSFTHPYIVPNPYDFSSVKHNRLMS